MHWIDWTIVVAYLAWLVWDGIRLSRRTDEVEGYFLAHRSLPWWAVGLSVMATQMSAITLVGTTGQGYADGIRFVQFYFGLPIAMVILSLTLVPFFRRANVFTAYEFLERRFGLVTRLLTSLLFLVSRGLSCGVIISAPAIILSVVLGWNLPLTVLAIGAPTVFYTMKGGVQAVTWADVKQMVVIVAGLFAAIAVLVTGMPDDVGLGGAFHVAGSVGKLQAIDFSFDLTERYTFWSGTLAGLFLMLSYFGCDQSQVQRYLTAKSTDQARRSLLMSAYWKIPLQALVLLVGVLVFVFYLFKMPPLLFNPAHEQKVRAAEPAALEELEQRFTVAFGAREAAARTLADAEDRHDRAAVTAARQNLDARETDVSVIRAESIALAERVTGEPARDVNYIIPRFVLDELPLGLAGLFLAGVMAAAMSSIAAELNSLSTATVIDFYRRWIRPEASDAHFLNVSKLATGVWGVFACVVATFAANLGSLIEVVNRFGSFFYGSILGVFLLAMIPGARAIGAFLGLIAGMMAVAAVTFGAPSISFLWHNIVGAVTVVVVGMGLSLAEGAVSGEQ